MSAEILDSINKAKPFRFAPGQVFVTGLGAWAQALPPLLGAAGLPERLKGQNTVLLKPNLVEASAPPITTPVALVEALVVYLRMLRPELRILIAEGCGAREYDTDHCFRELGYEQLADFYGVELLDLNRAPLVERSLPAAERWPRMHLPAILFDSFVISLPVLKAHTLAGVTLSLKNMMGVAPPRYYQQGGHWKKAAFHERIHEAIYELNCCRAPDFSILDATVGMRQAHLWGPPCNPPPNQIVAAADPVAVDVYGCRLLGRDWRKVGYLNLANGHLGQAEPLEVVRVGPVETSRNIKKA